MIFLTAYIQYRPKGLFPSIDNTPVMTHSFIELNSTLEIMRVNFEMRRQKQCVISIDFIIGRANSVNILLPFCQNETKDKAKKSSVYEFAQVFFKVFLCPQLCK
jgi:hypothetical protein